MTKTDMLREGDWVTQYASGIWQVERVLPKYADDDYQGETTSWKKGDLLGQWALLRKAFTPKMKFRLGFDVADARWCRPVSAETLAEIDAYFAAHPKDEAKVRDTPRQDRPTVLPVNLHPLTDDDAARLELALAALPERFTQSQFRATMEAHGLNRLVADVPQPGGSILYLFTHLYEVDSNGDMRLFGPELKRFE